MAPTGCSPRVGDHHSASPGRVLTSAALSLDLGPNFGNLPHFPNIGGAAAIAGWNDPNCGTCWQLTYNGTSVNVLAIDHAQSGFNIALGAMNTLTNNNAAFLGRINAQAQQVDSSACGL